MNDVLHLLAEHRRSGSQKVEDSNSEAAATAAAAAAAAAGGDILFRTMPKEHAANSGPLCWTALCTSRRTRQVAAAAAAATQAAPHKQARDGRGTTTVAVHAASHAAGDIQRATSGECHQRGVPKRRASRDPWGVAHIGPTALISAQAATLVNRW